MTYHERVAVLRHWGYPAPQAAFLAHVLVLGGCFLRRQFVAFHGRRDGRYVTTFLHRLVSFKQARRRVFGRRTCVYHLDHPALYDRMDESNSRDSRRGAPGAIVHRLMTLDVVLNHAPARVLATEAEKCDYFTRERGLSSDLFPATWYPRRRAGQRDVIRYFADRVPIVLEAADDGGVSFLYVQRPATSLAGWTTFLYAYASLLTALPRAEVVFCSVDVAGFEGSVQAVFDAWRRTARARQWREAAALRMALQRHPANRRWAEPSSGTPMSRATRAVLNAAEHRFRDPRYADLYPAWRTGADRVLDECFSRQMPAHVEHVTLRLRAVPHQYDAFGTAIAHDLRCPRPNTRRRRPRPDSALAVAP